MIRGLYQVLIQTAVSTSSGTSVHSVVAEFDHERSALEAVELANQRNARMSWVSTSATPLFVPTEQQP